MTGLLVSEVLVHSCIFGQQTDAKAVALMLSALNFLRTCRLTAMEGEGEKRRSKKEPQKDPLLLGMEQNPPAQWPKVSAQISPLSQRWRSFELHMCLQHFKDYVNRSIFDDLDAHLF